MKALVTVVTVTLLLAFAFANVEGARISVVMSPNQHPSPLEVPYGAANVSGGMFRVSAFDTDLSDITVSVSVGRATNIGDIGTVKIVYAQQVLDRIGGLIRGSETTFSLGSLEANTAKDFEILLDISGTAMLGNTFQLKIDGIAVANAPVETSSTFPVWGNVVKIVSPAPNLWMEIPSLQTYQDSLEVVIGTGGRTLEAYSSADVSVKVSSPLLVWLLGANIIGTSAESWSFSVGGDMHGGEMRVAMAGTSRLEENKPFLRIVFDTSPMKPGDVQTFSITVRLNESSYQLLEGAIRFSCPPGDVNMSGQVTALDAALILQWLVGRVSLESAALASADVSGNGEVTAFDAALILEYLVGIINNFPVQDKAKIPIVFSIQPSTAGGGGSAAVGKITASVQPTITIGKERTTLDGNYIVPILIDRMNGVIAGEFEIWPVNALMEVAAGEIIKGATFLSHRDGDHVKIAFAGDGNDQSSGGGELFMLKFSSKPTAVIRMKARVNENPAQMISTSIQQKSWGEIKAGFRK